MLLPGIIAKGLAIVDALLDFWVDTTGTTTVAGVCGNVQVQVVDLNTCGLELVGALGPIISIVLAALPDLLGGLFAYAA